MYFWPALYCERSGNAAIASSHFTRNVTYFWQNTLDSDSCIRVYLQILLRKFCKAFLEILGTYRRGPALPPRLAIKSEEIRWLILVTDATGHPYVPYSR